MKRQYTSPHLTVFESELFRTTSTCIVTDAYLLLVDPNWLPSEIKTIQAFAAAQSAGKEKHLLFTHSDYDHIIGYGAFPGFKTIASQRFVDNPKANEQLQQTIAWDDEHYIRRDYPLSYPTIQHAIAGDGQDLRIGPDDYRFYQAPGHNYDGLLTFNRSRGILIVGDYLSNIEFPYVYHSFAAYRATLNTLETIIASGEVQILITGHGDHTTNREEMERRICKDRAYLDGVETAVRSGQPFDFAKLMAGYDFPIVMGAFHEKNLLVAKREFEG